MSVPLADGSYILDKETENIYASWRHSDFDYIKIILSNIPTAIVCVCGPVEQEVDPY